MQEQYAQITWLDTGQPYSTRFDDVYFSRDDEIAESQHVFLAANDLHERWQRHDRDCFILGELGFGSGLNFLLTWQAWREVATPGQRLHYIGLEKYPLHPDDLARLFRRWPQLQSLSSELLAHHPGNISGLHRLQFGDVCLDLYIGDAQDYFSDFAHGGSLGVDCWYLDGFTPAHNPELWQEVLCRQLAQHSRPGCTLSTFTVAAAVRQHLTAAGFALEKLPGHGRKRHMLRGTLGTRSPASPRTESREAAVIGAGLAGLATAESLARRGWRVTVYEAAAEPFAGASGIGELALRCRLFRKPASEARFFLLAYLYAARHYQSMAVSHGLDWRGGPLLLLDSAFPHENPAYEADYPDAVLQRLTLDQVQQAAGIALQEPGYAFPHGGWVHAANLCAAYLHGADFRVLTSQPITALESIGGRWRLTGATAAFDADLVVVANSVAASALAPCAGLPLQATRGQLSHLRATPATAPLQAVVCGRRNLFPAQDGIHGLGSSYERDYDSLAARESDDGANREALATLLPAGTELGELVPPGSSNVRCNSIDHLPVIGAMPDASLYVNLAHSSSGLATTPLCGELIAAMVSDEPLPIDQSMVKVLSPMRFARRAQKTKRNRAQD